MKSYLISYDLNKPGQNYNDLYEAIKKIGTWWHHLDSTWIIRSSQSAEEIRDQLKANIDSNDKLIVIILTGEAAWCGFSTSGSKWLKDNL